MLSKANLRQTSYNVAATLVAAEVQAGLLTADVREAFHALADDVYAKLLKEFEEQNETSTREVRPTGGATRSAQRSFEDNGLDAALSVQLNYGAFKGLTLGEVLKMSPQQAAEYGYGDGNKSGRDYIRWLAAPHQENKFLQRRARTIIEAVQAGVL